MSTRSAPRAGSRAAALAAERSTRSSRAGAQRGSHRPATGRRRREPTRLPGGTLAALLATGLLAVSAVVVTSASALTGQIAGRIQAEAWSKASGARVEPADDRYGGSSAAGLSSGDWLRYEGVDLGSPGRLRTSVRFASGNPHGGTVELRADSLTGPVLASYTLKDTGGWQSWVTRTQSNPSRLSGRHDVLITVHSPQPFEFVSINWFSIVNVPAGAAQRQPSDVGSAVASGGHHGDRAGLTGSATSTGSSSTNGSGGTSSAPSRERKPAAGRDTQAREERAPDHRSPGASHLPATPPAPGAWIPVDVRTQAADTEAFFARTPRTVTEDAVRVPEFVATCPVSHHASDDPIVFPGEFGRSHNHTFFGNRTTDADSTPRSLLAGSTTCTPDEDHSAYWVPSLYQDGRIVDPEGSVTVYYGSRLADPSRTVPFPTGFRMISGDPTVQKDTPDREGNHFWCSGGRGEVGRTADGEFPVCDASSRLTRQVTFPDCWDGKHLDSPDHRSHVAQSVGGTCPKAFGVPIPNITFVIAYPLSTDTTGISLSSGTAFSMHADFFNAWEPEALAERVRNCITQGAKCGTDGEFL